tara:strand:+ start:140 stop:352 length:213 start_codon:yes stop_codon:yes gene_type:complete
MKSLLIKIGVGVSLGVNLFVFSSLLYNLKMYDKRVETNRIWLKGEIKDEVVRQIRKSMPNESGGVNVGNK